MKVYSTGQFKGSGNLKYDFFVYVSLVGFVCACECQENLESHLSFSPYK